MSVKGWIATAIIAPLIVGFILLKAEYSFFSKTSVSDASLSQQAEQLVKRVAPNTQDEQSVIETDLGNLETLFIVAQKIYGSTERNTEYSKLIKLALIENKPGFSFKVAQQIYGSTERNEQYINIIDKCLALNMCSLALKIADQIYGSTERNAQYAKIIEMGSKKRENSASSNSLVPTP